MRGSRGSGNGRGECCQRRGVGSGQGGALVRVDPAESDALIAAGNATLAVMGGRTMRGWLRVSAADLEADEQLTNWVSRAVAYAQSLPPKR